MKPQRVKGIGEFYVTSELPDDAGTRIAHDFLIRTVKGFASQATKYMRRLDEAPFIYSEKQLNSSLAPAFSQFTDAFLMESPIKRKWSALKEAGPDTYGWLDYWCYYRGMEFFIELKHSFISVRTGILKKTTRQIWNDANKQLEVIESGALLEARDSKGVFPMVLQVMPIFETVNKNESKFVLDTDRKMEIQKHCMKSLKPQPNWSAIWSLDQDIAGPYEYPTHREFYPGVLFMVKVLDKVKG